MCLLPDASIFSPSSLNFSHIHPIGGTPKIEKVTEKREK